MKKILFLLLTCTAIFSACDKMNDDAAKTPVISFAEDAYTLSNTPISVKITSTYTGVNFDLLIATSGDAVKDIDYTLSAEKFVVGKTPMLEIIVSPKSNYDKKKSLVLRLEALPEGVDLGAYTSTKVAVEALNKTTVSFLDRNAPMTAKAVIEVQLFDNAGREFFATEDTTIPVKVVDESKETAIKGTHYDFEGAPEVVVAKGKSKGAIQLKWLKSEVGRDTFYLAMDLDEKFAAGQFAKVKVTILGSYGDKIAGDWVLYKEVTDKKSFDDAYAGSVSTDGFGAADPADKITIEGSAFKTNMVSFYKDYFASESEFLMGAEYVMRLNMTDKITLQLLVLNKINRYFSPITKSVDDQALLGVRTIKVQEAISETETKEIDVLDVWILDYESKAFFPEFVTYGMYDAAKPTATASGVAINVQYKKVVK